MDAYQEAIQKRIEAARAWKRANPDGHGEALPDDFDFDSIASLDVPQATVKIQRSVSRQMKARFRKVEQQTNERVKKAVARRRRFGYVGIRATSRPGLIVAIHNKRILGYFSDPAEAAAVYDEHARRIDGDQAVLNGPNADLSDLYRKLKRNRPRG